MSIPNKSVAVTPGSRKSSTKVRLGFAEVVRSAVIRLFKVSTCAVAVSCRSTAIPAPRLLTRVFRRPSLWSTDIKHSCSVVFSEDAQAGDRVVAERVGNDTLIQQAVAIQVFTRVKNSVRDAQQAIEVEVFAGIEDPVEVHVLVYVLRHQRRTVRPFR